MRSHRVIDVKEGKGKEVVEEFVHTLEAKGGDKRQIEQVSLDMSAAFIAGTMEMLPNAQQTFDKFHLVQHANQAMDEIRQFEREGNKVLKKHKYTFLKDQSKLSKSKKGAFDHLLMTYLVLGES